jgi:hypothetical protein
MFLGVGGGRANLGGGGGGEGTMPVSEGTSQYEKVKISQKKIGTGHEIPPRITEKYCQ